MKDSELPVAGTVSPARTAPAGRHRALHDLLAHQWVLTRAAWRLRHELAGPRRLSDELAFLPAHLSLQETPPHPAPRRAALAICALFASVLAWSVWAEVDIVAVAPGRIVVSERNKTVQPLETSVVKAIHVANGDLVEVGQLLIELDGTTVTADGNRIEQERAEALSESLRARLLLDALMGGGTPVRFAAAVHSGMAPAESAEAGARMEAEWADIGARLAKLQAESQRRKAELETAQEAVAKLQATLPMSRQREADFQALIVQGFMAGHAGQDRTRERVEQERDLATALARTKEAVAAGQESEQARLAYRAETLHTLRERQSQAELKLRQLKEEASKAEQRTALTALRAPVAGRVQQLAIHTPGGVVTPAQALLVLVPDGARITAEVMLENKDIGFVREGQAAEIKLEAFPFTRYGTVPARVSSISADVVVNEPRRDIADQGQAAALFPATLALNATTLDVGGKPIRLSPGMNLVAEVKTGRRRVIDYLLSPVRARADESLRER